MLYVDSSVPVAILLEEPGYERLQETLRRGRRAVASNLLEAEVRAAARRERLPGSCAPILSWFEWVLPHRAISEELEQVTSLIYLRGADLWHVGTALYLAETSAQVRFFSCDRKQLQAAERVGLATVDGAAE